MRLTLKSKLERFPPVACRLLARRRSKARALFVPLSDEEVASRSGLRIARVKALAWETTWDGVSVSEMLAFMRGCGIDLDNRRTLWNHWRHLTSVRKFRYLTDHPDFESNYLPLAEQYERHLKQA